MKSRKINSKNFQKKKKRKTTKKVQLFKSIMNNKEHKYDEYDEYHDNLAHNDLSTQAESLAIEDKPRKNFSPRKILTLSKKFPSFSKIFKSPKKKNSKKKNRKSQKNKYSTYKNAKLESPFDMLTTDSTKFLQIPYSPDVLLLSDSGLISKKFRKSEIRKMGSKQIDKDKDAEEIGHSIELVGEITQL